MRAGERLSGKTSIVMLAKLSDILKRIAKGAIAPLRREGVTAQHPAMKAAKKLVADVRRLRGLVERLRSREPAGAK